MGVSYDPLVGQSGRGEMTRGGPREATLKDEGPG
jgi:hypothetical protein